MVELISCGLVTDLAAPCRYWSAEFIYREAGRIRRATP